MFSFPFLLIDAAHDQRHMLRVHRRMLRDTTNPFDIPNARFEELFRLNKEVARSLIEEMAPYMSQQTRSTFVPTPVKICAALHFFASGRLRTVGQDFLNSISKTIVHTSVEEVASVLQDKLMTTWIRFPQTSNYSEIKARFHEATGFTGVIGAIDCTHVKIRKPDRNVEHCYLNRKGYYSKNVQLVCDYDLRILGVNARYAGASHDAFIWENSRLNSVLTSRHAANDEGAWLLGDSEYPLRPWLITPFKIPANDRERNFNTRHSQARSCIERLNGQLKRTFQCLRVGLRTSPAGAGKIINACCVLHNFRQKHGLVQDTVDLFSEDSSESADDGNALNTEGRRIRDTLLNTLARQPSSHVHDTVE